MNGALGKSFSLFSLKCAWARYGSNPHASQWETGWQSSILGALVLRPLDWNTGHSVSCSQVAS